MFKRSCSTLATLLFLCMLFVSPLYAGSHNHNSPVVTDNSIEGDGNVTSHNNHGIINTGDVSLGNGAEIGGNITVEGSSSHSYSNSYSNAYGGESNATGGNAAIEDGAIKNTNVNISTGGSVGDIKNTNVNKAEGGNATGGNATGGNATIEEGAVTAEVGDVTNDGNTQIVKIDNPDKVTVNSHLSPMPGQGTDTLEYHGDTRKDHKCQESILNYILNTESLKPFVVKKHWLFTRASSKSASKDISSKDHEKKKVVYAFRSMVKLKEYVKNFELVGYTDTFSKGKADLLACFDQAVIDAGTMGGNILVIMKIDYIESLKSTTTGLGGSGAAGILKGASQSTVYGSALGYASSKAVPETDPYIHCMVFYSAELTVQ